MCLLYYQNDFSCREDYCGHRESPQLFEGEAEDHAPRRETKQHIARQVGSHQAVRLWHLWAASGQHSKDTGRWMPTLHGSRAHRPTEGSGYDVRSDVWSLGITLIEL